MIQKRIVGNGQFDLGAFRDSGSTEVAKPNGCPVRLGTSSTNIIQFAQILINRIRSNYSDKDVLPLPIYSLQLPYDFHKFEQI